MLWYCYKQATNFIHSLNSVPINRIYIIYITLNHLNVSINNSRVEEYIRDIYTLFYSISFNLQKHKSFSSPFAIIYIYKIIYPQKPTLLYRAKQLKHRLLILWFVSLLNDRFSPSYSVVVVVFVYKMKNNLYMFNGLIALLYCLYSSALLLAI